MNTNNSIALAALLESREQRVLHQKHLLNKWRNTVVSLTLVIPGEKKDSADYRYLFLIATSVFEKRIGHAGWHLDEKQKQLSPGGPEALYVIDAPAELVKKVTVELEETHFLGRLWDFDVFNQQGEALSRTQSGFPVRRCLLCSQPGHVCARGKHHPIDALLSEIAGRIAQHRLNNQPI
ncbi:citrate lyase holo-[acyl-carrier protein] synthase [Entomohabitans teleogrylli]|uniref:citrate lyase holo-[acyl-carrier protein] synthase n=1 Tax=Entomohabitans teleogrylli TaxID=1384589 RepID=UPI0008FC4F04|nr:citrate lyase holo-[acyl-carrier protein] synthase [Entomohabitans teleogrylli]